VRRVSAIGVLADGTLVTQDVRDFRTSNSGAVRLWNPQLKNEILSTPLWENEMAVIHMSPDGQTIIADIKRKSPERPVHDVRCYSHPIRREFSIISSSDDLEAAAYWHSLLTPNGQTLAIHKSAPDPNSKNRVAKQWTEIWDCSPLRLRQTIEGVQAFSPDGQFLVGRLGHKASPSTQSQPSGRSLVIWDVESGERTRELALPTPFLIPWQFGPSGRTLAVVGRTSADAPLLFALFDCQSGAEIARIDVAEALEFLPNSDDVIVMQNLPNDHWRLNRWDRARNDYRYHGPDLWHPGLNGQFRVSPDGRIVTAAVGNGRKSIHNSLRPILENLNLGSLADVEATQELLLLNTENGREMGRIPNVNEVVFSPDGRTAFAARDREIQVWDLPPHKPLAWFFTGTALIAPPISLVAWRRTRKLSAA
jgi:WD40 repeat protein